MPNAMYLRKSRAEDGMSTEEVLAKHRAALLDLAVRRDIIVTDIYEEVVSGESLQARPEMLRLLEHVRAGDYDMVLCMDIDRLGRGGMADQGTILDTFRASETLIVTPDKTYDLSDEGDEEITEFKAFMARREYKMIRKRMRRGLLQTMASGGYVANAPYGYRNCRVGKLPSLEVVEDEARFVRYIYQRYLSGVGSQTIAQELNQMGSTPNRSPSWSRNSVRHILRNPTFAGKVVWNRVKHYRPGAHGINKHHVKYMPREDWLVYDGVHEPIISQEDWERAQEIRRTRSIPSKNHGQTTNPFAGLIVCSICGRKMQRMNMHKGVPYILCTTPGCCAAAKAEYVEQQLFSSILQMLDNLKLDMLNQSAPDTSALESALEAVGRELKKIEARVPRLYEFLEDGTYTREIFHERLAAADAEKTALLEKQNGLLTELQRTRSENKRELISRLEDVIKFYPTLDAEGKNQLLKRAIEKVYYTKHKKTKPRDFHLHIVPRYFPS